MQDWQPAPAEAQWQPPPAPRSEWAPVDPGGRRARHYGPEEPVNVPPAEPPQAPPYSEAGRRARSRHSAEYRDYGAPNFAPANEPPPASVPAAAAPPPAPPMAPPPAAPPPPQMAPPPHAEPAPRHRGADPLARESAGSDDATPSGGQSVADLLARLQVEPSGGGRRRRRDG
jgi:hypothetical protein